MDFKGAAKIDVKQVAQALSNFEMKYHLAKIEMSEAETGMKLRVAKKRFLLKDLTEHDVMLKYTDGWGFWYKEDYMLDRGLISAPSRNVLRDYRAFYCERRQLETLSQAPSGEIYLNPDQILFVLRYSSSSEPERDN